MAAVLVLNPSNQSCQDDRGHLGAPCKLWSRRNSPVWTNGSMNRYEPCVALGTLFFDLKDISDWNATYPALNFCCTGAAVVAKRSAVSSCRRYTRMLLSYKREKLIEHLTKIAADYMCLSLYCPKIACSRIIQQVLWPFYAHSYLTYTSYTGHHFSSLELQ